MQKQKHMQDREFEKQVRQKMEELKFSPSTAVWTGVEKEITKDKKRRRPILVFFLLGALLLSGSLYLLYPGITNKRNLAKTEKTNSKIKEEKLNPSTKDGNATESDQQKNKKSAATEPFSAKHSDVKKEKPVYPAEKNADHGNLFIKQKTNKKGVQYFVGSTQKNNLVNDKSAENETVQVEPEATKKEITSRIARLHHEKSDFPIPDILNEKIRENNFAYIKTGAAKQQNSKKFKPWTIGFSAGAGFSNIYQGFFETAKVGNNASPSYGTTNPGASGGYQGPSSIGGGFSYSAGMLFQKAIGRRSSLSLGLNYHYYSTSIQTGAKIDSTITLYNNTYPLTPSTYRGYYVVGETNTHTNRYHFIELPVNLLFQINQSKKMPIFWEAGILLSYMVASDELHFNDISGVYYNDKSSFNKMQLNAATGLMVGWHFQHGPLFQAGPQFQYRITGLLPNSSGSQQHLFFGGLKVDILLPKKN